MAEEDDDVVQPSVQLGFSEPLDPTVPLAHTSAAWDNWDGGQIGGTPSWLNPKDIPSSCLTCRACEGQLRFICQLYAPADDVNENAYHRTLYVFACPTCRNVTEGSVRVLRCQLPLDNPYYPPTGSCPSSAIAGAKNETINDEDWKQHLPSTYSIKLCAVCGQRGKGICPVQKVSFCGRDHQKEYKKYNKQDCGQPDNALQLPSVYSKSELVVDEEPAAKEGEEREALVEAEEDDPDADLEQDDVDAMTGQKHKSDPMTTDFHMRVQRAQDQCLRYYPKWQGEELWITSEPIPSFLSLTDAAIPMCCEVCGAVRKCEFQIMPQMLHHLLQGRCSGPKAANDSLPGVSLEEKQALQVASEICEHAPPEQVPPALKEKHDETIRRIQKSYLEDSSELDFGVICVYTCTASCTGTSTDELGAYLEEYAWKQPPP